METTENIEGYFKARCSYLVCKHSAVHPEAVTKTIYAAMASKFEAEMQQEIIQSLNKCEDNKSVDLIDLLNRLLQVGDKARILFSEINGLNKKSIVKSSDTLVAKYN